MGSAYGNLKPSVLDNDEHDASIKAKRIITWPDNTQQFIDYTTRTDGQPTYIGYAIRGLSQSSDGWMIQKFTYESASDNARITSRQIAYDTWSNRASATYA